MAQTIENKQEIWMPGLKKKSANIIDVLTGLDK